MRQGTDVDTERLIGLPANIEIVGEFAERSMSEHIVPPRVVSRRGHVIRNDIEQDLEIARADALDEAHPGALASQIVADVARIRDVVTMRAARHGLQARREIQMADA